MEKGENVMSSYKVFTVNPGSTSTKIALFQGGEKIFSANVSHDAEVLAQYQSLEEQLQYRNGTIHQLLEENRVDLSGLDACVGRGGALLAMEGGVYEIDDLVLDHSIHAANGVVHPASLGPSIAKQFADRYGAKAYVVNPPDVDELQDLARLTGIRGVYRVIHLHALNLKETAIRHAGKMGRKYEECNFVVCHIGGGISVSAHRKGRMIDGYDIVGGEGPMAPTRCGSISVADLLEYAKDHELKDLKQLCTKSGGFVSHLGVSDAREVIRRAGEGDKYAELVWNTMIYQIEKGIGAMAAALHGNVDGILLGGGMVYSENLVGQIKEACEFIAPVSAYPGEFEMEAMASGAERALDGVEAVKKYTGVCSFTGFDFA